MVITTYTLIFLSARLLILNKIYPLISLLIFDNGNDDDNDNSDNNDDNNNDNHIYNDNDNDNNNSNNHNNNYNSDDYNNDNNNNSSNNNINYDRWRTMQCYAQSHERTCRDRKGGYSLSIN